MGGEHNAQSGQEDGETHLREKMKLLLVHRLKLRCVESHIGGRMDLWVQRCSHGRREERIQAEDTGKAVGEEASVSLKLGEQCG